MTKLSKFELLPLEVRRIIYHYYFNSPVLDYNEQLRHDKHMRLKASSAIVTNCTPSSLTSMTEQFFYRQDPNERTGYWSNLRELYVDVNFFDANLPAPICAWPMGRCQPINLRARGYPLIKIETRGETSSLRVSSLFPLASAQAARVKAKVEAAIKFDESGLRPRGFYGEHILNVIEILMWMLPIDEEMFWSPTAACGREAPLFWQVQLDAQRLSRVKSKLRFQYLDTPSPIRGREVMIDEAAKMEALGIPAQYEHIIVELNVPERAGRDDWASRRKLRVKAKSIEDNMGLAGLFSSEE